MSLLDEAKALMIPRGPACTLALLKLQHPDQAAEIDELIAGVVDKTVHASVAGGVLRRKFDVKFADDAVRRHARGVCACRY